MDLDPNSTRLNEMGEPGTSASSMELSFLSISTKSIWADGRDQATIGTTPGSGDLESRMADICTRLPPPPIPPWLESSPDRLRHLVSNYSCWERYAELCSINIPYMKSSSRTQLEDIHGNGGEVEDAVVSRLVPFLAAITVGLLMVGVVAGAYFWHQRKRRKFSFTAKYMKQPSPTRDYCSPNFYMTPSVTVETQLSLCALVDDNFRIQPFSIYKEEAWPYSNVDTSSTNSKRSIADSSVYETLSTSHIQKSNEILLKPDQLEDIDQDPFYPSTEALYNDAITTRSIPGDIGSEIKNKSINASLGKQSTQRRDKQKHSFNPCQTPMLLETNSNSPYVQIQSLHDFPDSSNDECHSQLHLNQNTKSPKRKGVMGGAMRKCKDAGSKVMAKMPWKSGVSWSSGKQISSSPSSASTRRLDRPIRALRQSLKGLRGSFSHRRLQHTAPQSPMEGHCGLAVPSSEDENC